jgi:glucan phosphoethanolaminetransferase (alkaline phosphatase superfamily)
MNKAELVESIIGYYGLAGDTLSLYITVISAYLIVAYLAGHKLERSQMAIISVLFVVMSATMSYAAFAYMHRGFEYAIAQESMNPNADSYATPMLIAILPLLMMGGIVASLYFMWQVRHPKTE